MRILSLLALVLAFAPIPGESLACGGPDYADLGPVEPLNRALSLIVNVESDFGSMDREELRFLYPFWKARPGELDALWKFAYGGDEQFALAAPSLAAMEASLRAGRVADAEREARGVIDAIYAMPPVPAARHRAVLFRAVEVVELAHAPPASSNPRAASLEYSTLEEHMRTRIANGWGDAIRQNTQPSVFADLLREADQWLARYPQHPLADLVRLAKIRVRYFQGDFDGAWEQALALYPARRVRALCEMRYLLQQGNRPSAKVQPKIKDLELLTALTTPDTLDAARAESLWRRVSAAPAGSTRTNLEERLLAWAAQNASPGKLPASFPSSTQQPTPLWAKLRAVALLRAEQWDRAREQLALLPADPERSQLLGHLYVRTGHAEEAAVLPDMDRRARQYVISALLTDAQVEKLAAHSNRDVRELAGSEAAVRQANQGKWDDAIRWVEKARPERAAVFRQAKAVATAAGPDRDLAWARFLSAHHGQLFSDGDPGFYRAVSTHDEGLAQAAPERAQIRDMLARTTERWLAIESYTRWLVAHPRAPQVRDVLAETDQLYGLLTNWGGSDAFYWGRQAKKTSTVGELLRVGAEIRKGKR